GLVKQPIENKTENWLGSASRRTVRARRWPRLRARRGRGARSERLRLPAPNSGARGDRHGESTRKLRLRHTLRAGDHERAGRSAGEHLQRLEADRDWQEVRGEGQMRGEGCREGWHGGRRVPCEGGDAF